ncbi:MAG TPA: hypothetical protein VMF30_01295 [Pirellulales bacterium]|nr:hypothetical protein [Pirellulales bacterium]
MTRMRIAAAGLLVFAGGIVAALLLTVQPSAVFAGRVAPSPVSTSGQLITQMTALGDNRQQLVAIDPEMQVMAVYQIDAAGEVMLKSVRNFHWDLQMEQFNGTSPLPQEIRSLVNQH